MNTDNNIHDLIHSLGKSLSLQNLKLDENNSCAIEVHDTVVLLQWEQATRQFCLTTAVGELSDGDFQELAVKLLQANYVWNDTRGASLALDAEAEIILLCQWVDTGHLNLTAFHTIFETFINLGINWKRTLPNVFSPAATSAASPIPADAFIRV